MSSPAQQTQSYGTNTQQAAKTPPVKQTKIEPKVYLAAERTLLNWLRVAVLIGTFSIAMINAAKYGAYPTTAKVFAAIYALIGVGTIIYAYFVFQDRRRKITSRYPGHFDELYGPIILCAVIFSAVLANFIFQVINRENHVDTPKNPWLAAYLSNFVSFAPTSA